MSWQASIQDMFNNPSMFNGDSLGGASAGAGGLSGLGGFLQGSPWMAGAAGLSGLLGGIFGNQGARSMGNDIKQGMGDITKYADQGLSFLDPYNQQGQAAMGQYSRALGNMSDPVAFMNNIMGQYQQSPQSQFNTQEMLRSTNNAAAAGGQLGSPAEQMAISRYQNQINNTDQQQFLNNALGINTQYLGGLQGLSGMGLQAAGQMNQNRMSLGDAIAQMYQNLGMSQMSGDQSMGSGLGSLIGGAAGIASLAGMF